MSTSVSPNGFRNALVLGGGGAVGILWMTGLAVGLQELGIDLSRADRFVGTSAGAVVAANLANEVDLVALVVAMPAVDPDAPPVDGSGLQQIIATVMALGLSVTESRRRIGELALERNVGDPADHVARMSRLLGSTGWPDRDLVVTATDVTTGGLQTWFPDGKATLGEAVAASTSVPGIFPPIPVDGRYFIDGGMISPINAGLAAGAELIVVVEPMAGMFPHAPSDSELGDATVIFVVPDDEAKAAIGSDVFDRAALRPAYDAGWRQAAEVATRLREVWPTA
ncbi:patatin-like phospholipase family protein [Nocardia sp. NPDC046763]|uniref:patatin-like phospholipase family protein n=1 Tax=Nocardia sp. NPDC046763 TaxID=3155256 RepID=UPI00340BBCBF